MGVDQLYKNQNSIFTWFNLPLPVWMGLTTSESAFAKRLRRYLNLIVLCAHYWSSSSGPKQGKVLLGFLPLEHVLGLNIRLNPVFDSVCVCVCARVQSLSRIWLFVALWTVAHQAPLSVRFSRQEYWSGLPYLPPGDLPDPGIEPISLASPALADRFFTIVQSIKY